MDFGAENHYEVAPPWSRGFGQGGDFDSDCEPLIVALTTRDKRFPPPSAARPCIPRLFRIRACSRPRRPRGTCLASADRSAPACAPPPDGAARTTRARIPG